MADRVYSCGTCQWGGPAYEMQDHKVCECRFNPATTAGFPVVAIDSFCGSGKLSEEEIRNLKKTIELLNERLGDA